MGQGFLMPYFVNKINFTDLTMSTGMVHSPCPELSIVPYLLPRVDSLPIIGLISLVLVSLNELSLKTQCTLVTAKYLISTIQIQGRTCLVMFFSQIYTEF